MSRDDRVVADIVAGIPGVTDPAAVRSLLTAWWEHAAREAAAGRVVDSGAFIAERRAADQLELPPTLAERVIEREFALLHGDARTLSLPTVPDPVGGGPRSLHIRPATGVPRPSRTPERLEALVGGGLVVVGSLLVGLALAAGEWVGHVPLPGGRDAPLVTPWKAWLAVLGGCLGAALALLARARRPGVEAAVRLPGVALGGLAVAGLGLLGGSVVVTALGGVVFGLVGAVAALTRR